MIPESKLVARVLLSNIKRLNYPYKLSFAITYRCNLRCRMCFIWEKPKLPELTTQEIESFFTRSNKFSWVGLTGGEVFLREDLLDIVGIILKNCKELCVLHFPTNGYLKDKIVARVREMLALKPKRLFITISVDGPMHTHDRLRGTDGSFRNAIDTFVALRNIPGANPYLSMTLCGENLGLIDETIASIKDIYPAYNPNTMMNFNVFQKSAHYFENTHLPPLNKILLLRDLKKALAIVGAGAAIKNYLQNNYLKFCAPYLETGRSPLPCQALSASCLINPYGEVFPCGVYDRKIGNIKECAFRLDKLWNDKEVKMLQRACRNGDCPGCWTPCDAYQSINGSLIKLHFLAISYLRKTKGFQP